MSQTFLAACAERAATLRRQSTVKALLLGTSQVGKSTLAQEISSFCECPSLAKFVTQEQADAAMLAFCMAQHPRLGAASPALRPGGCRVRYEITARVDCQEREG